MKELPASWIQTTLGEIVSQILGGGTPSKANDEYFRGTIPFMTVKDMHKRFLDDAQDHISDMAVTNSSTTVVLADTLVVATRMSLGKVARPQMATAINQDLKALIPCEGIDKTYVEYLWRANAQRIQALGTGTTVKGIRLENIRTLEVPLAPQLEQARIADKLDAVLARVDACRDRLDRIPVILKRFRQSVLAAATVGGLTEDWRLERDAGDAWMETDVQSVAKVGTGSTPLRSSSTFFAPSGTPWITSAATSQSIVVSAEEFVTDTAIAAHRLKLFPVGTLLVAMYGEGKTRGQVTELGIAATINQACAAIVVNENLANNDFVKLALQANYYEMRELAEGGNQPNLNLSKIKEFPLQLPPLGEQTEIVHRVESLFAYADRLEARYSAARAHIEQLTPATLAKAFRGELVPQDPNDEPASALLKRIRAQRDDPAANNSKRGRQSPKAKKFEATPC